jgi:hypothetical protein
MGIGGAAAAVPKRPNQIFLLFLFWFILALTQSLNHEVWRDEIRPLSDATQFESIWELMRNHPRDGHPLAWPILLHLAYKVFHTNAILPVLNFSLTAAAVLVFLLRAPFGWPILVLFTFSAMTLNEYPVINRNYSMSMLLMIMFAAVYSGEKRSALLLAGGVVGPRQYECALRSAEPCILFLLVL